MRSKFLLPHRYKRIGLAIFIPALVIGLITLITSWEPSFLDMRVFGIFHDEILGEKKLVGFIDDNILNEILGVLIVVGGIMSAFSREKDEDELITKIRLESLVWATYWNYGILLVAMVLVYGMSFLWVMIFNLFTIMVLFILRFNWSIRRLRQTVSP